MTEVSKDIFRAYDIRGIMGEQLDADVARQLGKAIAARLLEDGLAKMVVGRDGRLSGPELVDALIDGLCELGIEVVDIGAVPTPVVYFAAHYYECGSCVAVTGSHNPPDYNGFKLVIAGHTLSGDEIMDLYVRIKRGVWPNVAPGRCIKRDVRAAYIQRICDDIHLSRPFKVVVDAGNGIAGELGPQLLKALGCEVVPLFCEVDGTFPNHHPDPSNLTNLEDLQHELIKVDADLGIAFDGDADRLGVVLPDGEVIFADRLLMLFAQDVLSRHPGATIIYDVKCTGHLASEVEKAGGKGLMWKTGHSLIKAKMQQTGALLAGEMSGHFFFKERWYGFDDGIYAAARLLEIVANDAAQRSAQAIMATLPNGVSTPELKIDMGKEGANHAFIDAFQRQADFAGASLLTIDGVRADWDDGWGLVRASNTTPTLVLRFDADNEAALARIKQAFKQQLLALDATLVLPF